MRKIFIYISGNIRNKNWKIIPNDRKIVRNFTLSTKGTKKFRLRRAHRDTAYQNSIIKLDSEFSLYIAVFLFSRHFSYQMLQKYPPKLLKSGFFRSCDTRRLYGTKECWNRPGNLINRKYCSRRVDIDVQSFPNGDLVTKLASSEVGTVGKRSDFPRISLWGTLYV